MGQWAKDRRKWQAPKLFGVAENESEAGKSKTDERGRIGWVTREKLERTSFLMPWTKEVLSYTLEKTSFFNIFDIKFERVWLQMHNLENKE